MATAIWTYRDQTLRGRSLNGFDVEATDGRIGRVERTASDSTGSYLVVDAGTMAPLGGRILIPAGLIDRVELDDERVQLRSTRDQLTAAPAYDWRVPLEQHHRDQFASYYGSMSRARQATPARRPARSRSKSTGRRARSRASDQPTKKQLYEQARKLGIDGRSKMSKAQLARAVGRRRGRASTRASSARANPVAVQKFLEGVGYPARRGELVKEAKRKGASAEVRKTLERLPDKRFRTPTEVSKAIGSLR
jgi:hypothetical protein